MQTVFLSLFYHFFSSFSSPTRIRTEFILVIFHLSQKVSQKWSKKRSKIRFRRVLSSMPFWALFRTFLFSVVQISVRIQGGHVFCHFFCPKKVFTFCDFFIFNSLFPILFFFYHFFRLYCGRPHGILYIDDIIDMRELDS